VAGKRLGLPGLKPTATRQEKERLTFTYATGDQQLQRINEWKPASSFVPDGLQPGQFQGLFLENVAATFTAEFAR
jgi:hypothetical protein